MNPHGSYRRSRPDHPALFDHFNRSVAGEGDASHDAMDRLLYSNDARVRFRFAPAIGLASFVVLMLAGYGFLLLLLLL